MNPKTCNKLIYFTRRNVYTTTSRSDITLSSLRENVVPFKSTVQHLSSRTNLWEFGRIAIKKYSPKAVPCPFDPEQFLMKIPL